MENLSTVNAEPAAIVEPQNNEPIANEPVNAGSGEVATPQEDSKPIQTPEQNAEFARLRRETESKAKDALIAEMYGESHGIYTYADYQKAVAEQKAQEEKERYIQETGVDPDAIKPLFEQFKEADPDFQELKAIKAEKNAINALNDLNAQLKDVGMDLQIANTSDAELNKLPNINQIVELMNDKSKNLTLAEAFFLANKKDIITSQAAKAQQETIQKINANNGSSPGSLAGGGEESFVSFEEFEKNKNDQKWIIKNFSKITQSRPKW